MGRRGAAIAFGVFVLLTAIHTWPLVRDPAHYSRVDNGDGLLNTWALAWVAHQLPRHPTRLFEANIFYPERLTLGYSEAMVVQGIFAMPIRALGGSPVLAYSLVLIAGFTLTGWAFCLLVRRWTGSWSAGYVAGSLAAFTSHVLVRLAHMQTLHVEFVALMLFALDRLAGSRKVRDALLLGLAFALQGLTSVYLLIFSTWLMIVSGAARIRDWWRQGPGSIARLALSGGLAVTLMGPYLYWYGQLHRITGWSRTADDQWAASWKDYLATGSRLHYWLWSHRFLDEAYSKNFPGLVAVALAVCACCWPEVRRDERFRMCGLAGLGCLAVSFATYLPFYPILHRTIPMFQAVRVPAHLGEYVLLMLAVVAGFGVAGLQRRWPVRSWTATAVVVCALVNVEAFRGPIPWATFTGIPAVYDVLADEPNAVVVELPLYAPRQWSLNGTYMLNSTRHWRPMVNGYSGFRPQSYVDAYEEALAFPDLRSLAALHARGITHVVVHKSTFVEQFGRERYDAIAGVGSLQRLANDDDIDIYRLVSR